MPTDLTLPVDGGFLNVRVGAIIQQNGKFLMVYNPAVNYCYSVGGRIQFGETAEQAVIREVEEETGVRMSVDRLGFIHEAFFYGDGESNRGQLIYEISFYFYMNVPAQFTPVGGSFSGDGNRESLAWLTPESKIKFFPAFFRTELKNSSQHVRHIVTDERKNDGAL